MPRGNCEATTSSPSGLTVMIVPSTNVLPNISTVPVMRSSLPTAIIVSKLLLLPLMP